MAYQNILVPCETVQETSYAAVAQAALNFKAFGGKITVVQYLHLTHTLLPNTFLQTQTNDLIERARQFENAREAAAKFAIWDSS